MVVVVRRLAVVLLVGAAATSARAEDYPVVDRPVPAFGAEAAGRYVDDIPIVRDSIAPPWEPTKRLSGPRCRRDGLAVPEGW